MHREEGTTKATLTLTMALSSSIRKYETRGEGSEAINMACFISTSLLAGCDRKPEENTWMDGGEKPLCQDFCSRPFLTTPVKPGTPACFKLGNSLCAAIMEGVLHFTVKRRDNGFD